MSPFEHVLRVWKDPNARRGPIERAAGREPLLLQLGRLYRQRFQTSADSPSPPDDWQLRDLESQVGMRALAGPAAAEEGGWVEHAVTGWVDVAEGRSAPEAVLVLGQAGAGKGAIAEELCQYFLDRGGCVVIDRYDLQYLHPNYAALLGEDDRAASRAVFSDVVDLVEALYHKSLAGQKNLILDGSLLDAPSASVAVRELHAKGYRTSVLVLCVPPDVSWRATQERHESQRRVMGVGRWVDCASHDESCQEMLAALRAVEEQGLADEIHVLTREGEGLLSSFRACGHVPGRCVHMIESRWNPTPSAGPSRIAPTPSPDPPVASQTVIVAGGRTVKVGSFRAATRGTTASEPAAATPAPTEPRARERPQTGRKGVKIGDFTPVPSATAPPTKEPHPVIAPVPKMNAAPPPARSSESAVSTVRRTDSGASTPQERQPSAAEERAIQRRRMLQAKLRSKVKPREDNS
jgi:hypothetical protein